MVAATPHPLVTAPEAAPRPSVAGAAGSQIRAGFLLYDDPNTETRGPLWYGNGYRNGISWQMRRDPFVRMCLESVAAPLLSARWDVEPADDSTLALEVADFVRFQFLESLNWQHFLLTGTTDYVSDGFTLWEFTDRVAAISASRFPSHPQPGAAVLYSGPHHRPTWTKYQWHQSTNDPTKIDGVTQLVHGADAEFAGLKTIRLSEGALLWRLTWEQQGADFEGFPILRSAYGPFKEKRLLKVALMIYYERAANALPSLEEPEGYNADKGERDVAQEILRNIRVHENGYLSLPAGWKFSWSQPAQAPQQILEAINACDHAIAVPFNVGFMLLSGGSSSGTGSRALATEQRGQYILAEEKHARAWEYALNVGSDGWSPVERTVRLNYGADVGLPRIVARSMPLRDMTAQLTVIPQLIQAGALVPDDPFRASVRIALDAPPEDPATATPRPVLTPAGPTDSAPMETT